MRGLGRKKDQFRLMGNDHHPEKISECGAEAVDIAQIGREADILIVAVKPYAVEAALNDALKDAPTRRRMVISVAAGVSVARLQEMVQGKAAVVRCMPNMPVAVGMGAFGLCLDDKALDEEQKALAQSLLEPLGRIEIIPEAQFGAFSALVGCGPAYIFYVIEALAEAGVRMGFPRARAIEMASWLCAGSAQMALHTKTHPAILREQVCSPAGSTIEGVARLDEKAVKAAFCAAVNAAWEKEKSREH